MIERYGTKPALPDNYVFPILDNSMDEKEKMRVNQNFIRFVNQHIQKLAKDLGLDTDISTYYAATLLQQRPSVTVPKWN